MKLRSLSALAVAVSIAVAPLVALPAHAGPVTAKKPTTAVAQLETLKVKGRAAKTGYKRSNFGATWADVNKNKCDTRNDILKRDLKSVKYRSGSKCKIDSGTLADPYTNKVISFKYGASTSSKVQIDHVVALSDAWQKGAQKLSKTKRTALANDPLNLVAVDGPTNSKKGDKDAATWLPPSKAVRCEYVARQIAVKAKYGLWVTSAEKNAMKTILKKCPKQKVATSGAFVTKPKVTTPTTPAPKPTPVAPSKLDPKFSSCKEAKSKGYGPYKRGSTEYTWYRDGDGDGVVCE